MTGRSPERLLEEVKGFVTGSGAERTFAMAPDALGSDSVRDLVRGSFPLTDGKWVLTAVPSDEPRLRDGTVVLTGTSTTLLGVEAPRLHLSFDLADQGKVALLVTLEPKDWNPGVSFPSWRDVAPEVVGLVFDQPRLRWSSITRDGTSTGLNLAAAEVRKQGTLAALAVFPDLRLREPRGALDADPVRIGTVPSDPLVVGGLRLPLAFTAVVVPAPEPCLELGSRIVVGHGVPDVPVSMRTRDLKTYLILDSDLTALSRYALTAFADFLHGAKVADVVKDVLEVPETIVLRHLSAVVGLDPVRLASVALKVGTGKALTIIPDQVAVPDVVLTFTVEDPTGEREITALLAGTFRFLGKYDLDVSAYYTPTRLTFTGVLDPTTEIPLSEVVRKYLPSTTWLPALTLNRLELSADLRTRQFSFGLTVVSDWAMPVGAAALHLTEGTLDLAYRAGEGFDGAISGKATVTGRDQGKVASFAATIAVRSAGFELKGTLSEVSLTKLADAFADAGVVTGSGVPEITLRKAAVVVRRSKDAARALRVTGAAGYEFAAGASLDIDKFGQVTVLFAARRTGASPVRLAYANAATGGTGQAGFLVGILLVPDWNPKAIWPPLGDVFDHVTVRDAALLLSTDRWTDPLPGLEDLPYPVEQGVTFAGSLLLTEKALKVLSDILPPRAELDLAAIIDTAEPLKSTIRGTLPEPGTIGAVEFTRLVVSLAPTKFSLEADAKFTVHGETLHLVGRGAIDLKPPALDLSVAIENWVNPFGIHGLTVKSFGLGFTVDASGLSIGLIGTFLIGSGDDAFTLTLGGRVVNFEAPKAFVFSLKSQPGHDLTLARIVGQFTGTDLDRVPLLKDVVVHALSCFVVADPNGWDAPDGTHYAKGFGFDVDVEFFGWALKVKGALALKGVVASGSIDPAVKYHDLFELTDATNHDAGPHVDLDTTVIGQPGRTYFDASGRVKLLGVTETFSGHADSAGFRLTFGTDLAGLFHTTMSATLSTKDGFAGAFSAGTYGFDLTLRGDVRVAGITIIPKGVRIKVPNARLTLSCRVSARSAGLHADLRLDWKSVRLDPAMDLAVSADVLTDVPKAIAAWISEHAAEFFEVVLEDVGKWLALLLDGALWVGQSAIDIVKVLYTHFRQSVAAVADALLDLGKHGIDEMAKALVDVCGITMKEAWKLLEKNCAVTKAANAL
ncbi:hypothetical protein ACWEFJ_23530 [Actinosynnema sp. NPDC004786]